MDEKKEQIKLIVEEKKEQLYSLCPPEISHRTQDYTERILSLLSEETRVFVIDFLIDFFKLVYDLPASPTTSSFFGAHHQQEFGLFLHSLEVCYIVLKKLKEEGFQIEEKEGHFSSGTHYTVKPAKEYIAFLGAICHDIGKVMTYKVIDEDNRREYKPFLENLYEFKQKAGSVKIEFLPADHKSFTLIAFTLLTKSDFKFITEPRPTQGYWIWGLEYLFDVLSFKGATNFGRNIIEKIAEADRTSVVEYFHSPPQQIPQTIREYLVGKYDFYYHRKQCYKSSQFTAFLFPVVVKEIARDVLKENVREDTSLSAVLLEKIFYLLEDGLVSFERGKYVYEVKHKKDNRKFSAIFVKNDWLGERIAEFPENLDLEEWEILIKKKGPVSPTIKEAPEKEEKHQEKKEKEDEILYQEFKSLPIVENASAEELEKNIDQRKSIAIKKFKTKHPNIPYEKIEEFLEKVVEEKKGEVYGRNNLQ